MLWGPLMVLKRLWRICKVSNIFIIIWQCYLRFSLSFSPYCTVKFSSGYICHMLLFSHFSHVWLFATPLSMEFFPARLLEWVAISFSRGSSRPKDRTHISCIASGFFPTEPPGKPICHVISHQMVYRCRYENPNSSIKPNTQEIYRIGK